jgi:hypothetical protein
MKVGMSARRDPQEVDQRDLPLGSFAQPDVVGGCWIGAHEGIVQLVLAGEDLLVHLPLIVVPDPRALPREHGADAQKKRHPLGLENPALGVPKRPALTFEHEPVGDLLMLSTRSRPCIART